MKKRARIAPLLPVALMHVALSPGGALAWGPDGHAIVAELAQRRLGADARGEVQRILGPGHSLAAESTWADDVRGDRPQTFKWHFVDIPLAESSYRPSRDCPATPKGDCIVAELERVRQALHCAGDGERREALLWAVHLVADLHQPMHTVGEEQGGNTLMTDVVIGGLRCPRCKPAHSPQNLHWVWDTSLIAATTWSWGGYVRRLEAGWLSSREARNAASGSVVDWTNETHAIAREVWAWTPEDHVIRDDYYRKSLPVIDRQLGRAGLRLAAFLDDALAPRRCGRVANETLP